MLHLLQQSKSKPTLNYINKKNKMGIVNTVTPLKLIWNSWGLISKWINLGKEHATCIPACLYAYYPANWVSTIIRIMSFQQGPPPSYLWYLSLLPISLPTHLVRRHAPLGPHSYRLVCVLLCGRLPCSNPFDAVVQSLCVVCVMFVIVASNIHQS